MCVFQGKTDTRESANKLRRARSFVGISLAYFFQYPRGVFDITKSGISCLARDSAPRSPRMKTNFKNWYRENENVNLYARVSVVAAKPLRFFSAAILPWPNENVRVYDWRVENALCTDTMPCRTYAVPKPYSWQIRINRDGLIKRSTRRHDPQRSQQGLTN